MRILCDITVLNNNQPQANVKHTKATLAISLHPPNKENSELYLIIFTNKTKHQSSQRYKVKDNLTKVFSRFADEGKLTLQFQEPNQSLQIRTDPTQLKAFLSTLKLALNCSKEERNKIGLSSVAVTAIASKAHPVTKLTILNRGDFPTKGLPRTLTQLNINGIGRCRIDMQIVYLKQLQVLDVSDNLITKVPKPLGDMNLKELNLAKNNLGDVDHGCDWKWLRGENLQRSLRSLNLSDNKLQGIPFDVFKCQNLVNLQLDRNLITRIPFAVRKMTVLRHFGVSGNNLETLPSSIETLRLDTIDISGNPFTGISATRADQQETYHRFPSLFEVAARFVEMKR